MWVLGKVVKPFEKDLKKEVLVVYWMKKTKFLNFLVDIQFWLNNSWLFQLNISKSSNFGEISFICLGVFSSSMGVFWLSCGWNIMNCWIWDTLSFLRSDSPAGYLALCFLLFFFLIQKSSIFRRNENLVYLDTRLSRYSSISMHVYLKGGRA